MKHLILLSCCLILAACGPLAAVSAIGATINNAAYNQAERDLNDSRPNGEKQAMQVAVANMNLGVEYMRQGAYEQALERLNRSLLAKPDFAPSYNILGLLYQQLGDDEQAEASFKKSLKFDPDDSSTYNNYGLFLCNKQRIDEAETLFLNAANNPFYDSPEIALTNAGVCVYKTKPEASESYFKEALSKNAQFSHALLQMADITYKRNEYLLSSQYFERYKKNAQHTPKSLWLGIRLCHELERKDDLSSYVLLLKNKFPESEETKEMLRWDF